MSDNKKLLQINCNWISESPDASNNSTGSWTGQVVQYEDGKIVGLATDAGHTETTHVLAGIFSPGEGITITKIRIKDASYDPIYFDAFANKNGAINTYYGQFAAATYFQMIPMGVTSVEISQKEKNEQTIQNIEEKFEKHQTQVNLNSLFHGYILNETLTQDIDYAKKQIIATKDVVFENPIPDALNQKQPS